MIQEKNKQTDKNGGEERLGMMELILKAKRAGIKKPG